jgi:LuxR family transcriptional regulator, maltose regulon positive regulatory protein
MATPPLEPPVSKLRPPNLHSGVVERHRLLARLDASSQASLTLLLGYAGSGKSVLLASWLAARPATRFAWMSCEQPDADPLRFWSALVASVRLSEPSIGDDTLDRIELDGRVDLAAIGMLSDELRSVTGSLVIVIDDLHDAADDSLWPLLSAFVEWLPPAHHVVLASRSEPPLPLHRWRVEGRLAEIRNAQLAFDDDEAAELLAGLGVSIDRDAVSLLARRTEGWAAGLQLAGLSVRDRDDASTYLLEVASTDRNLADYLIAEVLDQQPDDVTDFLLATSVLRSLDARACRAITGHLDAHERLRDIEARGLFLVPLDHERRRYRYHHLFAQLLQAELRLRDEQRELDLHETASVWYVEEGDLDLAVYHAVRARATAQAVTLLRDRLVGNYFSGVPLLPTRLIDLLDDATLGRERELALEFALTVGMNGALDEAGRWLRRLAHLDDMHADTAADTVFRGRLAAAQAFWEMARGGAQRAMSHTIRARQLLDPTDDIARELTVSESRVRHYLDDLDGVRRLAAGGVAQSLPPMATVVVTGAHGAIEGDAGYLDTADRLGRAALGLADEGGTRQHYAAGEALRVVASVHLERLELDQAEPLLEQAIRTVERERPAIELLCLVDQVWLLVERRRIDDAFETITRAEALAERLDPSAALLSRVTAAAAHLHLLVGETERAAALVRMTPTGTRRHLVEARLALAQRRVEDAVCILDDVVTLQWPRYELEAALLRAQAALACGRSADDVEALVGSALTIADEHRFIRSLLVDGGPLDDVLRGLLRRAPAGSHRDELGRHLRSRTPLPRTVDASNMPFLPSSRELEILRHLATGLSNREIAATLYISLNTMKTHVRSLYRRLGVSSRSQAVAAGRARGLL